MASPIEVGTDATSGLPLRTAVVPSPNITAAAITALTPSMADEVTYLDGINPDGTVAATAFASWAGDNGDKPGAATSTAITYNQTSTAFKWGASQTSGTAGGTITYSFTAASNWTDTEKGVFRSSMAVWSAEANVTFTETDPGSSAVSITRGTDQGAYQTGNNQPVAVGSAGLGAVSTGLISIDTSVSGFGPITSATAGDGYPASTVMHELGHLLGLGHGGPYNGTVVPSTNQNSAFDTRQFAIMSYIAPGDATGKYAAAYTISGTNWGAVQAPETPMMLDIAALQALYGAPVTTPLSGGQTFGFNSNITGALGNYFDFSQNATPVLTLYDAGAGNTLNLSGYGTGSTINLNAGTFSSANGMVNNIGIALGTAINTAVGGAGDDSFTVNAAADSIDGGAGNNTVVFTGAQASYSFARTGNTLTVTNNATSVADQLLNVQTLTFSDGSVAAASVACYALGTAIATPTGNVAVEALRIGDLVLTASGAARPLRWIGRRSYDGRFVGANPGVLPIHIKPGALADGVPVRDLFVSPQHAMAIDGVLVPASLLVNGSSIVQAAGIDRVDYFHLELESHDILLAEGAPSESFVDDGSRGMFRNAAEFAQLYPEASPHASAAAFCLPRVEDGMALEGIRRRLAARTAPLATTPHIDGHVDVVTRAIVSGWARGEGDVICVQVLDNGVVIGTATADAPRGDLADAGLGACAFVFDVPGGLDPARRHAIEVRTADGTLLVGSPFVLDAAPLAQPAAGSRTTDGNLDLVTRDRITGWAWNPAEPGAPVSLQVLDNGQPIAEVLANTQRADLAAAGIGRGAHSFDLVIPGGLSRLARHVIEVRRSADGAALPGSPHVIEPSGQFDAAMEQVVSRAVAAAASQPEQDRVLSFVLAQAETLRAAQGATDSSAQERRDRAGAARRSGGAPVLLRRALVIDPRIPTQGHDAGSTAVLSHMQALRALGYQVSFVAADQMQAAGAAVEALRDAGIKVCSSPVYTTVEDVLRRQAGCFDVVYLHRVGVASRYMALVRTLCPAARVVYSVADLHHLRLERQACVEDRPELAEMAQGLRLQESMAAWMADAVITHSGVEAAALQALVPGANIHELGWHVPQRSGAHGLPFAQRAGVAFIGHYAHAPNRDAARHLVRAVMPLVWQQRPDLPCLLVGSAMDAEIRGLSGPNVMVLGAVADLGSVLDRVRLTTAPLRFGAGIKGKVLDSVAAGVPCAMSPVAAEGLGLPPAWIGADDAALAQAIVRLHDQPAAQAVKSAQARLAARFDQAAVMAGMAAVLQAKAVRAVA